jgi:FtsH-binding integral membrane protein
MDIENNVSWSQNTIAASTSRFMSRVYGWMALGIAMSGLVAWQISQNQELAMTVMQNRPIFWTLFLLQIGAVMFLSAAINRIPATLAGFIYFLYAALTGVTLSFIFLIYTQQSIFSMFFVTSIAFAGLSAIGFFTKRDLGPVGSFCMMGLFGMIGYSVLSFFFPSLMGGSANLMLGVAGIIVFSGLTAYDTQKIKAYHVMGNEGTEADRKSAIYGALTLYLDFINLFLSLLRVFGRRR